MRLINCPSASSSSYFILCLRVPGLPSPGGVTIRRGGDQSDKEGAIFQAFNIQPCLYFSLCLKYVLLKEKSMEYKLLVCEVNRQ